MLKRFVAIPILMAWCWSAQAVEERHGFLVGEVIKLDAAAKTVVIKAGDGTEHTLHFVGRTAVHGAAGASVGAKDAFHGLKEGSQVAAHYTSKGAIDTADEIDNVGKDGLKTTEATITHVDRGAKTLTVKTADGAEETYRLTDNAAKDAGKDVAAGTDKSAKTTVYYSEEGGKKIAHFFKRAI